MTSRAAGSARILKFDFSLFGFFNLLLLYQNVYEFPVIFSIGRLCFYCQAIFGFCFRILATLTELVSILHMLRGGQHYSLSWLTGSFQAAYSILS